MGNVSKNTCKWLQIENNVPKLDENFIKSYDEDHKKGYTLEVDIKYTKDLHDLHSDQYFKKCIK